MKQINSPIPFIILLILNIAIMPVHADTTNKLRSQLTIPPINKVNLKLDIGECYDQLCDSHLKLKWHINGESHTQTLIEDGYLHIVNIEGDEDGIIISTFGGRYDSEELRYHQRYRYAVDDNTFYKAESWATDSWWNPYIKELDDHLAQGAFTKAKALILKHGTSDNEGFSFHDDTFFLKFSHAINREARRAWLDGRKEVAAQLVKKLIVDIPLYCRSSCDDADESYIIPIHTPGTVKKFPTFNTIEATDKHHLLVSELAFYLLEGGQTKLAVNILKQVTRLAPTNHEAWLHLGKAYELQGNTDKAKAAYQQLYNIMEEQDKIAGIPHDILKHLDKPDILISREKMKQLWIDFMEKNNIKTIRYQGTVGQIPITAGVNGNAFQYSESTRSRSILLDNTKMVNGYYIIDDIGETEPGKIIWVIHYSLGDPITGWRFMPTGERQHLILSPVP